MGGNAPLALRAVADERFEPAVEAAAYSLVAEVVRRARDAPVAVCATRTDGGLLVDVLGAVAADGELVEIQARIGALEGKLSVQRTPAGATTLNLVTKDQKTVGFFPKREPRQGDLLTDTSATAGKFAITLLP